jgi:hypothetical protein
MTHVDAALETPGKPDRETALRHLLNARDHLARACDVLYADVGRPSLVPRVTSRSMKANIETRPDRTRVRRGSTLTVSIAVTVERVRGPFLGLAFVAALDGVEADTQYEYAPVAPSGKSTALEQGATFQTTARFHVRDDEREKAWYLRVPLDVLSQHVTARPLWVIYSDGTKIEVTDLPSGR